jgi:hypothetical protein
MKFVDDNGGHAAEPRVGQKAACQHAFGYEAEARCRTGHLFEANLVADRLANSLAEFFSDAARGHASSDAARLEDDDLSLRERKEGGRNPRRFAGSRGRFHDQIPEAPEFGYNLAKDGINWQYDRHR